MAENKDKILLPHNVLLKDRSQLNISGVTDVDCFDEESVTVYTDIGELTVKGENLHINKLCLETGELLIEGKVSSLTYQESTVKATSFFSRVFK
ncbi:MAG: sporulation protein YabP [Acutalibacteraceae bacterium]